MENSDISKQKLIAKKYIEENDLERIISEMINSLVHERVKNPLVYMIKYLAGLMTEEERKVNGFIIPEPYPLGQPISKYPFLSKDCLLKKYLTKELFKDIKYLKSKNGGNINTTIKISENLNNDKIGVQINDYDSLIVFKDLLIPIIDEYHNIDTEYEFKETLKEEINDNSFPFFEKNLNHFKRFTIRLSRNIKNYPFENICQNEKRMEIEKDLTRAINKLIETKNLPHLNNIIFSEENENKWNEILEYVNYDNEKENKSQLQINFPQHRTIYYNNDLSLIILINFSEHLEIIGVLNEENLKNGFSNKINEINNISILINKFIEYEYDKKYGFVTCDVKKIGVGMELSSIIICEKLNVEKSKKSIDDVVKNLNFDSYQIDYVDDNNVKIFINSYFKLSEKYQKDFIESFYSKISGLINFNREKNINYDKIIFNRDFNPTEKNILITYDKKFEKEEYNISSSGKILNEYFNYFIQNPKNKYGIFFDCPSDIKTFNNFVNEYLFLSQNYIINETISNMNINSNFQLTDIEKKKIESINICLIRNLEHFPFSICELNSNDKIEKIIINVLNTLNLRNHFGNYFSLDNENQVAQAKKIISENNLKLYDDNLYIKNRGVIQFDSDNIFALINDIDHIKFFLSAYNNPGEKLNENLFNILKTVNEFSKQIKFLIDENYGIITSSPKFLGTGLIVEIEIKVKMLNEILDKVCKEANESLFGNSYNTKNKVNEFSYQIISDDVDGKIVKVWNNITIGKSENEILGDILYFISQIFMVDKKLNKKQENDIIHDNQNIEINDNEINTTSNTENTF